MPAPSCTREQFVEIWNRLGSPTLVSDELGVSVRKVQERRRKIEAAYGISLECHGSLNDGYRVKDGKPIRNSQIANGPFVVNGVSTYYDQEGNVKGQWVKEKLDDQARNAAIEAAIKAAVEDIPRVAPLKAPKGCNAELLNLYTLTDCHIGMRAWHLETGEDWDLQIAENVIVGAMAHLINNSPDAAIAYINILGDWLHFDSLSAVTPTNGHLLDADGRYPKVVETAVRILRRVVDMTLHRHQKAVLSIQEGNHDMSSPVWNRHLFSLLYEREKRLEVVQTISPYHAHQHGTNMLAFHHGHLAKNSSLPLLFAATYPKMWGETKHRHCHTGHKHHVEEKEHSGMTVLQHPTIAARDAYAARGGWIAERSITSITYHSKHGQVARTTVSPDMLE